MKLFTQKRQFKVKNNPIMASVPLAGFPVVCNDRANKCFEALFDVLWGELGGQPSWYKIGDDSYEFWPQWNFASGRIECWGIKGSLRSTPFRLDSVAEAVCLVLPHAKYSFWDSRNAGHFHQPGSMYLKSGSDCFSLADEATDCKDWMNHPYGTWGTPKSWVMTPDREKEALDFLHNLIATIKTRKQNA